MLNDFLLENKEEILTLTERKALVLAGIRPSSEQLKIGLPIFLGQLAEILRTSHPDAAPSTTGMVKAAAANDEPALAAASGHFAEIELAKTAGRHGAELLRLGYTLSHVIHAYGSMCQAITEVASNKQYPITADEFHNFNRCLDVAIASAVTEFQFMKDENTASREIQHLGFLAHELRNALNTVKISVRLIQSGSVGLGGSTAKVLDRGLRRFEELIDRSLAEVRLNVDPKVHVESINLAHLVNQIMITADIDASAKQQVLEVKIAGTLFFEADKDLFYSALTNLIHNAIKYTHVNGKIDIRGFTEGESMIVEVEDECGGLRVGAEEELFKPFEQQNENRSGLGLGLTIARRAIALNKGKLTVKNIPGKGCKFIITIPTRSHS